MTDPLGHTSSKTYDEQDNVLTETNALGHVTRYTYANNKRPLSITDPLGRVTSMAYDVRGNLTAFTDASNQGMAFAYNFNGTLATSTDAAGTTSHYTYDAAGRQLSSEIRATLPGTTTPTLLQRQTMTYDVRGNNTSTTTYRTLANGTTETATTQMVYDNENRVVKSIYPDLSETQTVYNAIGKVASSTDQLGRVTAHTYNERGEQTSTTYPDGSSSSTVYDEEGRALSQTDRLGRSTHMEYDVLGRQVKMLYPDGSFTSSVYDAAGRMTSSTDALGNVTNMAYDAADRRTTTTDALGNTSSYTLNDAGLQTQMTDAQGNVTQTQYDLSNRPVKTIYADGSFDTTTYDSLGRRTAATDTEGRTTLYEYDALNRMTAVVDAQGQRTEYTFDERGQQLTQKDALGRITRYAYDIMGRRVQRTLPGGQVESSVYDILGRMTQMTDFNGHSTQYSYHPTRDHLIRTQADPAHPSLALDHAAAQHEYDYDVLGRRTLARVRNRLGDILHTQSWSYDSRDRITAHLQPLGSVQYSYDAASNLISTQSNSATGYHMSYEHDALNRMSAALDHNTLDAQSNPSRTGYAYTAVGTLQSVSLPNSLSHFYNYNSRHQLSSCGISQPSSGATPATVLGWAYTLNKLGMRTQVAEFGGMGSTGPASATPTRTVSYQYDSLHRLTRESVQGSPLSPQSGTVDYTLDAVGNRNTRNSTLAGVANQTQSVDANDRLTTDSTDANGNTLGSQLSHVAGSPSVADIYDYQNRLIRRVQSGGNGASIDLLYDADGNRVAKSTPTKTTHYLLDLNSPTGYAQVIEEHQGSAGILPAIGSVPASLNVVYSYGLDLISQDRKTGAGGQEVWTLSYYLYDGGGHVRALADETATLTDDYTYDAYGILLTHTGSTQNAYRYRGEQWDEDLHHYYQRARYLNQETGRFWTQDTYEGSPGTPASLHKYLYANGDPISGWDPSGRFSLAETTATVQIQGILNTIQFAQRIIGIYEKINQIKSFVEIIVNLRAILLGLGGELSLDDWKNTLSGTEGLSLHSAGSAFLQLSMTALGIGSPNWIAGLTGDILKGGKLKNYLIYLPSFIPLSKRTRISTGIKIGGVPLKLVDGDGGAKSGGLMGIGMSVGNADHQLFRMDYHRFNPGHGGATGLQSSELAVLKSGNYHMHVYKWNK
jgi:RHS repeat-associated protein